MVPDQLSPKIPPTFIPLDITFESLTYVVLGPHPCTPTTPPTALLLLPIPSMVLLITLEYSILPPLPNIPPTFVVPFICELSINVFFRPPIACVWAPTTPPMVSIPSTLQLITVMFSLNPPAPVILPITLFPFILEFIILILLLYIVWVSCCICPIIPPTCSALPSIFILLASMFFSSAYVSHPNVPPIYTEPPFICISLVFTFSTYVPS